MFSYNMEMAKPQHEHITSQEISSLAEIGPKLSDNSERMYIAVFKIIQREVEFKITETQIRVNCLNYPSLATVVVWHHCDLNPGLLVRARCFTIKL